MTQLVQGDRQNQRRRGSEAEAGSTVEFPLRAAGKTLRGGEGRKRSALLSTNGLLLAILLLGPGCGGSGEGESQPTYQDGGVFSAHEYSAEQLNASPQWNLATEPTLTLGSVDGEEAFRFFRITDAIRLGDRVIVLDGGSAELRVFHADGTHLLTSGGSGEGPGEFLFPNRLLFLARDSVAVWDSRLRRVSFFDSGGTFDRAVQIVGNFQNPDLVAVFLDGSFLFTDLRIVMPSSGVQNVPLIALRYGPEGLLADTLGIHSAGKITRSSEPPGYVAELFQSISWLAGDRETYWVTNGEEPALLRQNAAGDTLAAIRWEAGGRQVSVQHVAAHFGNLLTNSTSESSRRRIRNIQAHTPVASQFPAADRLLVAQTGHVWVRCFKPPIEETPQDWIIFTPSGKLVGRIQLPRTLRVLDLGGNHVLGVIRDEADVEFIQLFRIENAL